ncbi:Cu(I)-responsive transcriptional regulator [Methylophilus sp. Leaf408]|uniref:Cu(I)-responsive transcriptional regulator n=1 Tax=Methylophilus sp. Leaf408 TaxID=2876561 RepID=UPI001E2FEF53|nr:Cu(I)-responsive transcriptional regulator [Methylophilus sp. Leaf408]
MSLFNIGQAAKASGISTKMIRHYESVGLLPPASRTFAGYRQYSEKDIHTLSFIRHSRYLGFSIKQIEELLSLWQDPHRPSSKVKELANAHVEALNQKIQSLMSIKSELQKLVHCCHGDDRPECPILEQLALNQTKGIS